MTKAETFMGWLHSAKRGDRYIYHTGALAWDVEKAANHARLTRTERADAISRDLGAVRDGAYRAQKKGKIALFQRREGPNLFAYIAVRT